MLTTIVLASLVTLSLPQEDVLAEARNLIESQQFADAVTLLEGAREGGAEDRETAVLLAKAQMSSGDARGAIATLDSLGAGEEFEVALNMGRAYVAWANELAAGGAPPEDIQVTLADAKPFLAKALDRAPEDQTDAILAELGQLLLYGLGDAESVKELTTRILEEDSENGEALYLRGCAGTLDFWNAFQAQDESRIEAAYRRCEADLLAADQNLPRARVQPWEQLAWLYETRGEPTKAVDARIIIIDRNPESSFDELYRLSLRYSYDRRFEASGKALEKIVSLSARELTTRIRNEDLRDEVARNMAWSIDPFVQRNDSATARSILAAIVAADPKDPVIWHNYAVMCEQTSRFEDALSAYERIMELDETDPRPYNDAGTVLKFYLERDLEKANTYYDKCIAMADGQLEDPELAPARKAYLMDARRLARENLGGDEPAQQDGGVRDLLGSFVDALGSLNVPEDDAEDEDEDGGEADGGTDS